MWRFCLFVFRIVRLVVLLDYELSGEKNFLLVSCMWIFLGFVWLMMCWLVSMNCFLWYLNKMFVFVFLMLWWLLLSDLIVLMWMIDGWISWIRFLMCEKGSWNCLVFLWSLLYLVFNLSELEVDMVVWLLFKFVFDGKVLGGFNLSVSVCVCVEFVSEVDVIFNVNMELIKGRNWNLWNCIGIFEWVV